MTHGAGAASAALLLMALAGCAGPQFVAHPEAGIELRWPKGDGNIEEARQLAQLRCDNGDQRAVLTDDFTDQDENLVRFACR